MIVHYLHCRRARVGPDEADPIPFVDSDTVLASPIRLQLPEAIAGKYPEFLQADDGIQLLQFAGCDGPKLLWAGLACLSCSAPVEDGFRPLR